MVYMSGCPLTESAAARPRLKLLPRTSKKASDPVKEVTSAMRNTSIFGSGKPRDEAKHPDKVADEDERTRTTSQSSSNT